jgi:hypothetical protein
METLGLEALGAAPNEYKFYGGEETIWYDDAEHEYTRFDKDGNLIIIPGVTSAVHIIDKSGALTQWAANMATDYIRDMLIAEEEKIRAALPHLFADASAPFLLEAKTVESWLDDARRNFDKYKKRAAETGKLAHDWIEQFIRALMSQTWDIVLELQANLPEDERAANGVMAALDFMVRHKVRWIFTERKIYSRQHDYAGTLDGLAYVSSCGDPDCCGYVNVTTGQREALYFVDVLAIVDWKTSNQLYPEYHYQTAAYLKSIEEELPEYPVIPFRFVTRLGKDDGQFEAQLLLPESVESDFDIFLKCLALYGTLKRRKDSEKAVRDTVKAILKAKRDEEKAAIKAAAAAERERLKEERRQAKEGAKAYYKMLRAQKIPVKEAERLVAEKFGVKDEEPELEAAA